jgi:signal peptidase II
MKTLFVIMTIVIILDQFTKAFAFIWLKGEPEVVIIPGFLQLRYVTNTGAAFSMLTGRTTMLSIFSSVIIMVLLIMAVRLRPGELGLRTAIGLILGGAVGNLVDRIRLHEVIDFIDAHWLYKVHWPTFNIADTAVCIGMFLYLVAAFRPARESGNEQARRKAGALSGAGE